MLKSQVGSVVDDRLLRQLLVTWLAPVDPANAQQHQKAGFTDPAQQQQLPDLESTDLLPSLQLLPGICTGKKAAKAERSSSTASQDAASCCRLRLHGLASDCVEPCAMDEPRPARSPIEVRASCAALVVHTVASWHTMLAKHPFRI